MPCIYRKASLAAVCLQFSSVSTVVLCDVVLQKQAFDFLRKHDLIRRNFLQLNVIFDRRRPLVVNDNVEMTLIDLMSNLGGTFSLWLGVTTMFICEVVELLYVIGTTACCGSHTMNDSRPPR